MSPARSVAKPLTKDEARRIAPYSLAQMTI